MGEDYALYARALAAGARFLLVPTAGYVAVERADLLSARHSRRDLEALRNSDRELLAMNITPSEREALTRHQADIDRRAQWLVSRRGVAVAQLLAISVHIFPFTRIVPVSCGTTDFGDTVADTEAPEAFARSVNLKRGSS